MALEQGIFQWDVSGADILQAAHACGEVDAMNAYATSLFVVDTDSAVRAAVVVNALNNNANNNNRYRGRAGV